MKKIITTVGTSVFENFFNKDENKEHINLNDYKHLKDNDYTYSEWNNNNRICKVRMSISIQDENASAEIRSIVEICKQEPDSEFEVHLIATDTILSVLAAELICEWFNRTDNKEKPINLTNCLFVKPQIPEKFTTQGEEKHVIKSLRVDNKDVFEKGFMNLVSVLDNLTNLKEIKNEDGKKVKIEYIFNITGGYKAIIPIVTLLGQIKEVPLKYIYNDSELKDNENPLIEVGNLPFGLDWAVVEALKPFSNEYFINRTDIQDFSKLFFNNKIKFNSGSIIGVDDNSQEQLRNLALSNEFYKLFNALKNYSLIYWDNLEQALKQSAVGKIISSDKTVPLNTMKGQVIEHLFFKYFCLNSKNNPLTAPYSSNFSIPDIPKKEIYLLDNKKVEIGDIDIFLSYSNIPNCYDVWGEAKAKSSAERYNEDGGKYYNQLKARILYLDKPFIEMLLIIYRFTIDGIHNEPFLTERLKSSLSYLKKLNADSDLQGKSRFRCFGVSIPINFKGNKIDLTESFYKADFSKWEWEELYNQKH
jgi:CRISPR/Cas system-associated protein Csm6